MFEALLRLPLPDLHQERAFQTLCELADSLHRQKKYPLSVMDRIMALIGKSFRSTVSSWSVHSVS